MGLVCVVLFPWLAPAPENKIWGFRNGQEVKMVVLSVMISLPSLVDSGRDHTNGKGHPGCRAKREVL